MTSLVKEFREINLTQVGEVGGKNASLGEMISRLSDSGVCVPDGFSTTAEAFWLFIDHNNIRNNLSETLAHLDKHQYENLSEIGKQARELILNSVLPEELEKQIIAGFLRLKKKGFTSLAVRSSATAEDLPDASFAGQHDTFLNITRGEELLQAVKRCMASLYSDRAIKYREDHGFEHDQVALAVGVQAMVRADRSCSGVAFTIEPESGFKDVVYITGVWGLGENMVQGTVTPDEFLVYKPGLYSGRKALLQRKLGSKSRTMVFAGHGISTPVINVETPLAKQEQFVLSNEEVEQLATWCCDVEKHYGRPMDLEWAKDGLSGNIYIIQARPETVHGKKNPEFLMKYTLQAAAKVLTTGQAVGSMAATGKVRILKSVHEAKLLQEGDILVTTITSPDWDPYLKKVAGIVTDRGGRTSHASIVARELGVPAIVGCNDATGKLQDGATVTISCCEGNTGRVYEGQIPFSVSEIDIAAIKMPIQTKPMLILSDPDRAFDTAMLPSEGVGLLRMEFIISSLVKIHPMALVKFPEIRNAELRQEIESLTRPYKNKKQYFIEKLAEGIGTIAAAFYPREVIVRTSDFKTNEYANLVGGAAFEPVEENPMIGFRGAARYAHEKYAEGFALECAAINLVRKTMGFDNVKVMIPFCRTVKEARQVVELLDDHGLVRNIFSNLKIYMMAEIPSNIILADAFARYFDGFSIGSNDLTQLLLGVDRDSSILSDSFNENDPAVKVSISQAVFQAHAAQKPIGICGQAPSDDPNFIKFLVEQGIDSISFLPDALIEGITMIRESEQALGISRKTAKHLKVLRQFKTPVTG